MSPPRQDPTNPARLKQDPTGFLTLNKPAGMTSHDCVAVVRRVFKTRKVGHGGTLDPAATGVLPIAVGKATRFLNYLRGFKRYQATFQLGRSSTTDDATGDVLQTHPEPAVTQPQVETILHSMTGDIQQYPPLYSAIRREGKRLYELAREGLTLDELDIPPRPVTIHSIQVLEWRPGSFPEVDVDIACGPGTYIRSIARDLGQQLGCGGLMSQLVRSQSGPFQLTGSVSLDQLQDHPDPLCTLQPIESGFLTDPIITLDPEDAYRWRCGQIVWRDPESTVPQCRVVQHDTQRFLGLGSLAQGHLKVLRVLAQEE